MAEEVGKVAIGVVTDVTGLHEDAARKVHAELSKPEELSAAVELVVSALGLRERAKAVVAEKTAGLSADVKLKADDSQAKAAGDRLSNVLKRVKGDGKGANDEFRLMGRNLAALSVITRTIGFGGLVASIPAALSGIAALGSSVIQLAAELSRAVPLLGVIPAALSAIVQGAVTGKLAFSGVSDALKEITTKGTGSVATLKAQHAAQDAAAASADRIASATRNVARAHQDAADSVAAAVRGIEDAERRLRDAQEKSLTAQRELTRAREDATQRLEDLRFANEEASLSEEEAALRQQEARKQLADAQASGDAEAIRRAELRIKREDLNAREASVRNQRQRAELDELNRTGIEGSDQVVKARERVRDAEQSVAEAQRGVTESQTALGRAQVDAIDKVASAQRELAIALRQASEKSDGAGLSAASLTQKFDALSPAAKDFVLSLRDMKPKLDELKGVAAQNLFPGLTDGLKTLVEKLFPLAKELIGDTARALGDLGRKAADLVTSGPFAKDFEAIGKNNVEVIKIFGDAGLSVVDILRNITAAASPVLKTIAELTKAYFENAKKAFQAHRDSGKLEETFRNALDTFRQVFRIVGDIAKAFFNVGKAAGGNLLDSIEHLTDKFKNFTESGSGQTKIQEFFEKMQPIAAELFGLFGDLAKIIGSLAVSGNFADAIGRIREEVVPFIEKIFEAIGKGDVFNKFVDLLVKVAEVLTNITGTGSALGVFIGTLSGLFTVLNFFLVFPLLGPIIAAIASAFAAYKAISLFSAVTGISSLGKVLGNFFPTIFGKEAVIARVGTALERMGVQLSVGGLAAAAGIVAAVAVAIGTLFEAFQVFKTLGDPEKELDGLGRAFLRVGATVDDVIATALSVLTLKPAISTAFSESSKDIIASDRDQAAALKRIRDNIEESNKAYEGFRRNAEANIPAVGRIFDDLSGSVEENLNKINADFDKRITDQIAFQTNLETIRAAGGTRVAALLAKEGPERAATAAANIAAEGAASVTALEAKATQLDTLTERQVRANVGLQARVRVEETLLRQGLTDDAARAVVTAASDAQIKKIDETKGKVPDALLKDITDGLTDPVKQTKLTKVSSELIRKGLVDALDEVSPDITSVGHGAQGDLAKGLTDTAWFAAHFLTGFIGFAKFVKDKFKEHFRESPQYFTVHVGRDMATQLGEGLESGLPGIQASIQRLAKAIKQETNKQFSALSIQGVNLNSAIKSSSDTSQQVVVIGQGAVQIENTFGPGTNAEDVIAAMTKVARGEMLDALRKIVEQSRAGVI